MTMIANTQHVSSVLEAVREEFAIEHGQVMAGLSADDRLSLSGVIDPPDPDPGGGRGVP